MNDDKNSKASNFKVTKGKTSDPLGPNSDIARKLKQYYGSLVSEEVPDRFEQLLSRLDSAESGQEKS